MKRKISKFLALCLAVTSATAFSATGVSAGTTSGTIASSFTIESPTLVVTVPTSVKLYVNEGFDSTADTARKAYSIVSDDILVSNATVKDGSGVPVMVTVDAKLKADTDVNVEYETGKVDENGDETDKSVFLKLVGLNDATDTNNFEKTAGATNNAGYYEIKKTPGGATTNAIVTTYGSQIQAKLGAVADNTGSQEKPVYMGVSLQGEINTQAEWDASDLAVDISYKIKSTNANSTAKDTPANMTLAADSSNNHDSLKALQSALGEASALTNGLTSATAWTDNTFANDGYLVLQDVGASVVPTEVNMLYTDKDGVKTWYNCIDEDVILGNMLDANTSTNADEYSAYVVLKKGSGTIPYFSNLGKTKGANVKIKLFVTLSDGRVIVQDMEYPKAS